MDDVTRTREIHTATIQTLDFNNLTWAYPERIAIDAPTFTLRVFERVHDHHARIEGWELSISARGKGKPPAGLLEMLKTLEKV